MSDPIIIAAIILGSIVMFVVLLSLENLPKRYRDAQEQEPMFTNHVGAGWQKPVSPPRSSARPSGLPPKRCPRCGR